MENIKAELFPPFKALMFAPCSTSSSNILSGPVILKQHFQFQVFLMYAVDFLKDSFRPL